MNPAMVCIAGGESYVFDAETCMRSVKANSPGLPCILATDMTKNYGGWDRHIRLTGKRYLDRWYLDSTRYCLEVFEALQNDYDRLLFMDTDTYCAAPLDDMLRLADRFDVCGTHGVTRQTTKVVSDIPDAFPEIEIGALLVKTNEAVHNLFKDWLELYTTYPEVYGNNDQGPFREALWLNKTLNMFAMPEEYHARWGFGCCVVGKVRILHSRSPGYPNEQAAREINSVGGRRLFKPGGIWRPVYGETVIKK